MTRNTPPRWASWLLRHLADPYQREALAGDLHEEYLRRRSDAWYLRQACGAILARAGSMVRRRARIFGLVLLWWTVLIWLSLLLNRPFFVLILATPDAFWLFRRRSRLVRHRHGANA
jgi:hypothetical protein